MLYEEWLGWGIVHRGIMSKSDETKYQCTIGKPLVYLQNWEQLYIKGGTLGWKDISSWKNNSKNHSLNYAGYVMNNDPVAINHGKSFTSYRN